MAKFNKRAFLRLLYFIKQGFILAELTTCYAYVYVCVSCKVFATEQWFLHLSWTATSELQYAKYRD